MSDTSNRYFSDVSLAGVDSVADNCPYFSEILVENASLASGVGVCQEIGHAPTVNWAMVGGSMWKMSCRENTLGNVRCSIFCWMGVIVVKL